MKPATNTVWPSLPLANRPRRICRNSLIGRPRKWPARPARKCGHQCRKPPYWPSIRTPRKKPQGWVWPWAKQQRSFAARSGHAWQNTRLPRFWRLAALLLLYSPWCGHTDALRLSPPCYGRSQASNHNRKVTGSSLKDQPGPFQGTKTAFAIRVIGCHRIAGKLRRHHAANRAL